MCWIIGFVIGIPLIFGSAARDGECFVETEYSSVTVQYVSYVAIILFYYMIPICCMLAAYIHMAVILYRSASHFNGLYCIWFASVVVELLN